MPGDTIEERIADAIAAEREACAKLVDELAKSFSPVGANAARQIAGAIRARGSRRRR